jgi:hypothetical protein
MKIPLLKGRDFRASETLPDSVLVNETFAKQYFGADPAVGKSFEVVVNEGSRVRHQIVGLGRSGVASGSHFHGRTAGRDSMTSLF